MQEINWDEATRSNSKFITFEVDKPVEIVVTNWRLEKNPSDAKVAPNEIAFKADIIEINGEKVEKALDTTSARLKKKLRQVFENKQPTDVVKLNILRVGDKYDTQYSCREVK